MGEDKKHHNLAQQMYIFNLFPIPNFEINSNFLLIQYTMFNIYNPRRWEKKYILKCAQIYSKCIFLVLLLVYMIY